MSAAASVHVDRAGNINISPNRGEAPAPAPMGDGETAMTMQLRQALWAAPTEAAGAEAGDDAQIVNALQSISQSESQPRAWSSDIAVAEAEVTQKEEALPAARARRSGAMRLYFQGRIGSTEASVALANAEQHMANRVAELAKIGDEVGEIGALKAEHEAANAAAVEARAAQCAVRDGAVESERAAFGKQLEQLQATLGAQCSAEVAAATTVATRATATSLASLVAAEDANLVEKTAALRAAEGQREATRSQCYEEAKARAAMLAEAARGRQDIVAARERLRAAQQARRVASVRAEAVEAHIKAQSTSLRGATDEAAGIQFNIQHCERDAAAANEATSRQREAWAAAANDYSAKRSEKTAALLDRDRAELAKDVASAAEAAIASQKAQSERNLERWRSELHMARTILARKESEAAEAETQQRAVEEERHVVAAEDSNNAGIMHGSETILQRVRAVRANAMEALAELRSVEAVKAEEVATLDNEIGWLRPSLLHATSVSDMQVPTHLQVPLAPMVKAQYDSASQLAVRMSDVLMKVYRGEAIESTEKKMAELAMRIMTAEGYLNQAPPAKAPGTGVRVSRNGSVSINGMAPSQVRPQVFGQATYVPSRNTASPRPLPVPTLRAAAAAPVPSPGAAPSVRVNRHGSVSIGGN